MDRVAVVAVHGTVTTDVRRNCSFYNLVDGSTLGFFENFYFGTYFSLPSGISMVFYGAHSAYMGREQDTC